MTHDEIAKLIGRKDPRCPAVKRVAGMGSPEDIIGVVKGTARYRGPIWTKRILEQYPEYRYSVVASYGRNQGGDTIVLFR